MKFLFLVVAVCIGLYLLSGVGLWSLEGWQKWAMFAAIVGGTLIVCGAIIGAIASIKR